MVAPWIGAVAIVLAACAMVHDHTRLDSASFDEPTHIHAAYLQVFHHSAISNMEHPPLAKEIAGLGLLFRRPSDTPLAPNMNFSASAHRFLFENRVPADTLLAAARAPMLLFFAALCLLVFGVAKGFFGAPSAFLALVLIAFEPTLLAHAGIVHTDVPVSLFWLASVIAWGRVLDRRSAGRIVVAGLLLGGALATKFSAVFLLPTFALVAMGVRIVAMRNAPPVGDRSRIPAFGRALAGDIGAGLTVVWIALGTVVLIYQPVVSGISVADQKTVINGMVGRLEGAPDLARRIASISSLSRPLAQFAGGLAVVARQNALGGGLSFLDGSISTRGFPRYFFEAFAIKTSLPFLFGIIAAVGFTFRRRLDRSDALLWIPVVYYFLFSLGSSYNTGIRHILPVYPFLAVAVSRVPLELLDRFSGVGARRRKVAVIGAIVLLASTQVATAISAHPFELSYFNIFGGGMANGYRRLTDSNTDWGLDLRRVAVEVGRRGVRNPTVCYFGGDRVAPRIGAADFAADPRVRGDFVSISTTLWDKGAAFYAVNGRMDLAIALSTLIRRLKSEGNLVGRIGGSTLLYRLSSARSPNSGILRR